MTDLRAAVVGRYWGPNLARNFSASADFSLAAVCDTNPVRLKAAAALYPAATAAGSLDELLATTPDSSPSPRPWHRTTNWRVGVSREGRMSWLKKPLTATVRESESRLA